MSVIHGVPVWSMTSIVFVAQGIWIQSVAQLVPTTLPISCVLPVTLKDIDELGVFSWKADNQKHCLIPSG